MLGRGLPQIDFYDSRRHLGTLPGAALAANVASRAGALATRGLVHGDRIVLVASNTEDYLATLLAALAIGAVVRGRSAADTVSRGIGGCATSSGSDPCHRTENGARPRAERGAALCHGVLRGTQDAPELPIPQGPAPKPAEAHHIQLTSGSTSAPKAVLLSHGNVAHNIATVSHGMATARGGDRLFSWLPMYHDMGFIQVLGALIYGARIGLMTPLGFLRDPLVGSQHDAPPVQHYRRAYLRLPRYGRFPGAVEWRSRCDRSFRFAMCLHRAEPIAYSTLRSFTDSFTPWGFVPMCVGSSYGMAESVLARPSPSERRRKDRETSAA